MSDSTATTRDPQAAQKVLREFMELLPLTLAIAGLNNAEGTRSFTQEQMEARANVIQNAFRIARRAIREAVRNG